MRRKVVHVNLGVWLAIFIRCARRGTNEPSKLRVAKCHWCRSIRWDRKSKMVLVCQWCKEDTAMDRLRRLGNREFCCLRIDFVIWRLIIHQLCGIVRVTNQIDETWSTIDHTGHGLSSGVDIRITSWQWIRHDSKSHWIPGLRLAGKNGCSYRVWNISSLC